MYVVPGSDWILYMVFGLRLELVYSSKLILDLVYGAGLRLEVAYGSGLILEFAMVLD